MLRRYFIPKAKKQNAILLILPFCLFGSFVFGAAVPAESFQKGNDSYASGNYSEAIGYYNSILDAGRHSPEVYLNLGNAFLKNQNLGSAILNYERGLKLEKNHSEIINNLAIAQSKVIDEIEPLPPFFVSKFLASVRDLFSSGGWAFFSIFFLWAGLGLLILKFSGKKTVLPERFFQPVVIAAFALVALGLFSAFAKNYHEQHFKSAIILVERTGLKEGADTGSPDYMMLHEGTRVELLDKIGEWYKVRLADGDEGWLNEKELGVI